MIGQLFTQEFLKTGICDSPAWRAISEDELDGFISSVKALYAPFKAATNLNEHVTENDIIVRVLAKLGWGDILTQQIASKTRREDVPDMLLFPDAPSKASALRERRDHFSSSIFRRIRSISRRLASFVPHLGSAAR